MLEQIHRGALQITLFRRGHSGHDFHVLGGLFFHNVHGVVEGDDAHHPVLPVHHRQGQEAVLVEHDGDLFLVGLGGDVDQVGLHDVLNGGFVVLRQQQILHRHQSDQGPVLFRNVAGIDGLLVHTLAANPQDGLPHRHMGTQGDIFRGHDGACGVFRVAQNLIDGTAHLRVGVLQNPLDHVGGHLLHQVGSVVHIQLVQHFLQLVVREPPDQQLLGLRLHFHKGFRRQFLGQQTEQQRDLPLLQPVENSGDVNGIHGHQNVPQGCILLLLQHCQEGFFYNFKPFCHDDPPLFSVKKRQSHGAKVKQRPTGWACVYFGLVCCRYRQHPWWYLLFYVV